MLVSALNFKLLYSITR